MIYDFLFYRLIRCYNFYSKKMPISLKDHVSIRDSTLPSCHKGSYVNMNIPIFK